MATFTGEILKEKLHFLSSEVNKRSAFRTLPDICNGAFMQKWFNQFVPNAPFFYFLRFQGVEKGDIGNKWVKPFLHKGSIADIWQAPKCASLIYFTTQKMKLFLRDIFSKCDQICSFRQIWSHLLKKSLMENFIFCVVLVTALLLVLFLVK